MGKLLKNKLIYKIRNLIGLKPSLFNINNSHLNTSVSDGFFWRTDNGFKTIFRFMDIMYLFYDIHSSIEIVFFDKNNNLIKNLTKKIDLNNELKIDAKFLGTEDYGTFYVFHKSKDKLNSCLRQSCYAGYSFKDNIPSFVHGNTPTTLKDINPKINKINFGLGGKHFFKKKTYKVQNFISAKKTEISIINPCNGKLKVEINNDNIELGEGCSKLIKLNLKTIEIKSKCYLLRPIVFDYYGSFIDVYHG